MANEEKDALFGISLGEGLIDIPDTAKETGGVTSVAEVKNDANKKQPTKVADNAILNDDGSIEIDEFAKPETDTSDDDSEEKDTFIEKDEKKTTKKTPSADSSSDSSPSSSPYLAFAKDRANEGVFLTFTDEDWKQLVERNEGDEAQALRELHDISLSTMIERNVEKYKETLSPEERLLYEGKEKGVPLDKYSTAKRNYDKYSKLSTDTIKESEALQIDVVTRVLELRGYTPDEIKEEIEGYKALEVLGTKAEKALPMLPKAYKKEIDDLDAAATADQQAKQSKIAQRVAKMKGLIDNTAEIIPGIKLTKPIKEEVMESMTVPVGRDEDGNPVNALMATRLKNPEGFEMLMHYYHKIGLFNIGKDGNLAPDFSKIMTISKTKAVDSMRSVFEAKENTVSGKTKIQKTEDTDDEFEKAFRRFGR